MKTSPLFGAPRAALLTTALLLALVSGARASEPVYPDLDYTVTLNLASLVSNTNGPFSLDLQLVQGSGNVTNTVQLSNFSFVGGSVTGPDTTIGTVSGSIAPGQTVKLTSTSSDSEIYEAFSAGVTQISFNVDQTPYQEVVSGQTAVPEQFNVAILDGGLNNIPTTDPSTGNTLVSSDLGTSSYATLNAYSSVSPDGGVQAVLTAAPEPNPAVLSFLGVAGMFGLVALRRRLLAA